MLCMLEEELVDGHKKTDIVLKIDNLKHKGAIFKKLTNNTKTLKTGCLHDYNL